MRLPALLLIALPLSATPVIHWENSLFEHTYRMGVHTLLTIPVWFSVDGLEPGRMLHYDGQRIDIIATERLPFPSDGASWWLGSITPSLLPELGSWSARFQGAPQAWGGQQTLLSTPFTVDMRRVDFKGTLDITARFWYRDIFGNGERFETDVLPLRFIVDVPEPVMWLPCVLCLLGAQQYRAYQSRRRRRTAHDGELTSM
jgi:hypothetical protein